jgi:16S rRNA (adenine1518-N6/adenine1519-N6)-dimethyltransferase
MAAVNYDSPQAIRRFLDERGLGARKRHGQHFLIDGRARERLLDALDIQEGDPVWEVGPGLGAMTAGLLERGAAVTAFEIDRGFTAVLEELFGRDRRFALIPGDVLKTWRAAPGPGSFLAGNLPYGIAAPLLGDFIEGNRGFKRMVVTVQREVARRMAAGPGSKEYSSFSVLCASAYRVTPLAVLKGAAFYPEPKVESQGVCLDRLPGDRRYPRPFYPLIRCLFSARRKTVKNNLRRFTASLGAGGSGEELCMEIFSRSRISPETRAETLGVDDFAALAEAAAALMPGRKKTEAQSGNR